MGLVFKHTYSILDIFHNVCGSDTIPTTLIKLRSPLGKRDIDWKGPWNFSSQLWTNSLRIKLGYTNSDDAFFMRKEDFDRYFTFINVSRVKLNNRNSWIYLKI
jgi:hypothetical protein